MNSEKDKNPQEKTPLRVGVAPAVGDQMARRQSAPQPTAADFLAGQAMAANGQREPDGQPMIPGRQRLGESADAGGFRMAVPIGREQIQKANQTLNRYKEGKANLERKIVDNEQWYKLRHWECMRSRDDRVKPVSAWLFNSIANKHADAMDNFPSPNILPREEGDRAEAQMLSSILPVVLDQCEFEQVYSDVWMYKLKTGTGVYGVFWDKSRLNGLGDIAIRKVDLLNLFWEPGITDIRHSRNLFHVELTDNEALEEAYPALAGKLGSGGIDVARYVYDDKVDTSGKSVVVDWYYHRYEGGKKVLHYCKYVNDTVLFATENDPAYAGRGWYDHGEYPFVFDALFPVEGTPTGFGYIDVGKDAQQYIDRGNQAILENMLANVKPRYFVRNGGGVNEAEYADLEKDFVHVEGNIGEDNVLPIQGKPLNSIYVSVLNSKIDELKETTGNRDISTGGTASGVTAASAIAAMQEAGSKLSRDNIKASYRAFRRVCLLCVELIRQFYDTPRCFRIMGEGGAARFVQYSNQGIQPQAQGADFGMDMGFRVPLFDIEITAQKQSPYSKMSQNELALQFYQAGFFNPSMADQALACLDMMDFDRKEFIMQKVSQNGGMLQQLMMLAKMLDGGTGAVSAGIAQQYGLAAPAAAEVTATDKEALGGEAGGGETATTKKARERVAESTSPT